MSWYRKYRPLQFADIVGQDHICKILLTALQRDATVHAYLLSGPRGTGKTSAARILAKALNCQNPQENKEPCNECAYCQEINEGRFVDILEIDAASNTGVDHIRDLRDKIGFSPTSGKAKVYIIDEVHMLSSGAFNALLKTLEEPPEFVYFILATTEAHKVPETIQSRCQRFSFRQLQTDDIVARLEQIAHEEKVTAERSALELIATQAGGGLRDAISLFEQYAVSGDLTLEGLENQMGLVPHTVILEFFETLASKESAKALQILDQLVAEGLSLNEFVRTFFLFLRKKLLEQIARNEDTAETLRMITLFDEAQAKMKFAVIPQLPLEVAVIKVVSAAEEGEKEERKGIFGLFSSEKKTPAKAENLEKPRSKSEKTAEKEMEGEKAVKEVAKKSAEFTAPELNLEGIRQAWSQIIEKLEPSLLRMSLRNAEIVDFSDETLFLQFPAKTWAEQLENTEHQKRFLEAFENIFSRKIALKFSVKSVQLEPTVVEAKTDVEANKPSPVEMLEEIMGTKAVKNNYE